MAKRVKGLLIMAMKVVKTAYIWSATSETTIQFIYQVMNGEFNQLPVGTIAGETNTLGFDSFIPQVANKTLRAVESTEQNI